MYVEEIVEETSVQISSQQKSIFNVHGMNAGFMSEALDGAEGCRG